MSYSDWDPEELLNFDYGKPIPEEKPVVRRNTNFRWADAPKSNRDYDEDIRMYEQLRRQTPDDLVQQARLEAQAEIYEKYTNKKSNNKQPVAREEKPQPRKRKTKSKAALRNKNSKLYKFSKFLSVLYVLALAAFAFVMLIMNVLPFYMLIALYVVLGMLSFIIVIQLAKNNIKRWAKVLSTITAVLLIFVYGVGCAYGLGTLSFLSKTSTSVNNESKVESITKEPFNVVITGIDVNGTIEEQGRSDVNMLVTVNPNTSTILMTSIPRDYQVRLPDKEYQTDKLTHSGFYGVDTTIQAEEDLLNIESNYYVKVNFTTVTQFIYAVGGIDVYSDYEFTPVKRSWWTVKKGWNHMNGREALAFARERKAFPTGDNQRIKNQQAVFEAMIKKMTSSKTMVLNYSKILSKLDDYFEMSFSSGEVRSLVRFQLARNPKWKIYKNSLVGGEDETMGTYTTGETMCYVMSQDPTSVANATLLINAVMDGKKLEQTEDGGLIIVEESTDTE